MGLKKLILNPGFELNLTAISERTMSQQKFNLKQQFTSSSWSDDEVNRSKQHDSVT